MFRYRLYPSKAQMKILEEQLELCRVTYNYLLGRCKQQYREKGTTPTQFDLNKLLPALKLLRPELSRVHSQVLQNISKRIIDAHTGFHARRRAGLKAGLPRFKKHSRYKSVTYPQSGFRVEGDTLKLSKVGEVKVRLHRPLEGEVKTLTVKRYPSSRWCACFSCVVEAKPVERPHKEVGVDVGLESYAVLSDGTRIENPKYYRKEEKRLARLQRRVSRKNRGSHNQVKAEAKVARLHEKIHDRRMDFLHKASRWIADGFQTVYVEDLRISNMIKNRHLAKAISDASWERFVGMLVYKEEESGGRVVFVSPWGTTQDCSQCGEKVEKSLSDRVHACPHCGLLVERDLNAALNILARGREIGREPPEYRPVEEGTTALLGQAPPMNQEASLLLRR